MPNRTGLYNQMMRSGNSIRHRAGQLLRRLLVGGMIVAAGVTAAAQDEAGQTSYRIMAQPGITVNSVMMGADGIMFVGPLEIVGQSPDDLFTYWIGRNADGEFFGYDPYSGVWMPGPATYRRAVLQFQEEPIEGWVRFFAGMPDYRRVFGSDGRLYERYQNLYAGDHVYTYFVDMTTGERSDSTRLIDFLAHNREWLNVIVEQQRVQATAIQARAEELGTDYANWQEGAHRPPAEITSMSDVLQEIIMPESIVDLREPSLLDLIEDELAAGETE